MVRRANALSRYLAAIETPADECTNAEKATKEGAGCDAKKESKGSTGSWANRENRAGDYAKENCNKISVADEGGTHTDDEPLIANSATSTKIAKNEGLSSAMHSNAAPKWQIFPKTAAPSTPTSLGYNSLITTRDIEEHSSGTSQDPYANTIKCGENSSPEESKQYQNSRPNAVLSPEEFSAFASTPTSPGMASVISTSSVLNNNHGGTNVMSGGCEDQQMPPPPLYQQQQQQTMNVTESNQSDRTRRRWPPVSTAPSVSSSLSNFTLLNLPTASGKGTGAVSENANTTSTTDGKDIAARTKKAEGKSVSSASDKYKVVADADSDSGRPLVKLVAMDSKKSGEQMGAVPSSSGKDNPAEVSHDSSERAEVSGSSIGHGVVSAARNLFGSHEKPSAIRSRVVTAGSAISNSSTSGASGNVTIMPGGVTKWRRPPIHQIGATPTRPSQALSATAVGKWAGNTGSDKKYRRTNAGNVPSPPPRRFFPPSPSDNDHDLEGSHDDTADKSAEWGWNTLDESFTDVELSGYNAFDASGIWGGAEAETEDSNVGGELSRDSNKEADSREEIDSGTPERAVWKRNLSSAEAPGTGEKSESSNNTGATGASAETLVQGTPDTSRLSNTSTSTAARVQCDQQLRQEQYQKRHHTQKDQPQAQLEVDSRTSINCGGSQREGGGRGGRGNLVNKPWPFGRHMLRQSHHHRHSMGGDGIQDGSDLATEAMKSSQQTQAKEEGTEGNANICTATEVSSGGHVLLDKNKGQLQLSQNQYPPIKPSSLMIDRVGVSLQKRNLQVLSSSAAASAMGAKDSKEKECQSQLQFQPLSQLKLVEASSSGAVVAARKQVFGLKHGHGIGAASPVESRGVSSRLQQTSQQKQQGQQKLVDNGASFEIGHSACKEDCSSSPPHVDCGGSGSDSRTKSPKRLKQQVFTDWDSVRGAQNVAFPTPVLSCRSGGDTSKTGLYFPEWDSKTSSADGTSTKQSTSDRDGSDLSISQFSARSPRTAFSPWQPLPTQNQDQQQLQQECCQQNQTQPPSQPNLDGTAGIGSSNTANEAEMANSMNTTTRNITKKFFADLENNSKCTNGKVDSSEGSKKSSAIVADNVSTSLSNKSISSDGGARFGEAQCAEADKKVEGHKESHQPSLDEEPRMGSEMTSLASTLTTRLSMVEVVANEGQGKLQQPQPQQDKQQGDDDISPPDSDKPNGDKPNIPPSPRFAVAAANAVNLTRQGDERETVCGGGSVVLTFSSAYPSGHNLRSLEGLSPMQVPVLTRSTPSTCTPTLKAGAANVTNGVGSRAKEESPDPIMAVRSSPLGNEDEDSEDELSTTSSITTRPSMAPFLRCPIRGSNIGRGSTQVPKFPPAQVGASTPGAIGDVKVMPPMSAELWRRREAANAIRVAAAAAAMAGNTGLDGGLCSLRRGGGSGLPPPTPPPADARGVQQRGGVRSSGGGRKRTSTGGGALGKGGSRHAPVSGVETCGPNSVVSERMMGYLREMELRMEDRMLRLEATMEERIQARMEYLEQKVDARMDEIQKMLRLLIETGNNGEGWSSSTGGVTSSGRESSSATARQPHHFSDGTRLGSFQGQQQPRRALSVPDMTNRNEGEDCSVAAKPSSKWSPTKGITSKGQGDVVSREQERIQTHCDGQLDSDSDDDIGADENTQCSI
mmetsp:Transcript_49971/g.150298  ORF Transcript_49971/g.150298 Transcript_49971/m.150298 type:complete len:1656 (-) Transcript_49971:85-5052(-)|eukprot:CAMPEP_0113579692 /NCGR_PEP_ID=MMETSP0015_2-20120614/30217_1 /TAXON_ID=2838 /ORGANISM="Odontella" /LENGTH=1655 /DNA_ID=CAMNT_0000483715 /DNA_START=483 /DNA_END=5450 /DNA_ORIENTATION=+ /assembly_acc=CAM_ASM_000160